MNKAALTLGVLLGASLLLNAVLLLRTPASGAGEPVTGSARPVLTAPETALARGDLEAERARATSLEARVKHLEAEKAELLKSPVAAPAPDRLAAFREKIRKLVRMMKDPKAAQALDAEAQLEMSEAYMELFRMQAMRSKDPGPWVDALRAVYEIALEEGKTPLTAPQGAEIDRVLATLGGTMKELAGAPAAERLVKELEAERDAMGKINAALRPEQREGMQEGLANLTGGGGMGMQWIERKQAETFIVDHWSRSYGLDDVQKPALQSAAASYVAALDRLAAECKGREAEIFGGGAGTFDYRIKSARAQVEAIRLFQGSLTSEQQEKLRTRTLQELWVFDTQKLEAVAPK
jgi:hypothetical protein